MVNYRYREDVLELSPAKIVEWINDKNAEMAMKRIKQKTRITPADLWFFRIRTNPSLNLREREREREREGCVCVLEADHRKRSRSSSLVGLFDGVRIKISLFMDP